MKQIVSLILILFLCVTLKAQTNYPHANDFPQLKFIADNLCSISDYQADCISYFNSPTQGEFKSGTKVSYKIFEKDTLCGYYFYFEKMKDHKLFGEDFVAYFNYTYYRGQNNNINSYFILNEPDKFKRKSFHNGYIPAIHETSTLRQILPRDIGHFINKSLSEIETIISQRPDTMINGQYCQKYIIKSSNEPLSAYYELCFDRTYSNLFYYKLSSGGIQPQITQINISNVMVNQNLDVSYFTETNLFGRKVGNRSKEIKRESLKIGATAPSWELPILNKTSKVSSKDLIGKYVILEFTGTWCPHCWDAVKTMNRLEELYGDVEKLKVFSIFGTDPDTPDKINSFAQKENIKSTILYSAKEIVEKFKVNGFPSFFIIDPDGQISMIRLGYSESVETEIIEFINQKLK